MEELSLMKKNRIFTRSHRLLHWAMATVMLVLLFTGFLHEFWMSKHGMADMIRDSIGHQQLSDKHAVNIATTIRSSMWNWHIYMAYTIVILFSLRIIYMLIKGIRFPNPFKKELYLKDRIEGLSYFLFYLLILINIITGFYHLWGTNSSLRHNLGTIHKLAIYWFPAFLIIHFVGIVIGEIQHKKGITSKIIGGD